MAVPRARTGARTASGRIVIVGLAQKGPAAKADLRAGDVVMAVGGSEVSTLGDLFRRIWATGNAGVDVPMTISREGRVFEAHVASTDRNRLLKGPTLQ